MRQSWMLSREGGWEAVVTSGDAVCFSLGLFMGVEGHVKLSAIRNTNILCIILTFLILSTFKVTTTQQRVFCAGLSGCRRR